MPRDFHTLVEQLDLDTPYGRLLLGVVIAFIAWALGRAVNLAFQRMLKHPKYIPSDRTAIVFLGQLLRLIIYLFAFASWAQFVPSLKGLGTAWLASVGVISVVLGFAAQNTLGNFVAGVSLLLYRPFNLGDRLQVNAPSGLETGTVESLNLGYTVLCTADDRRIVIPNSVMASQTSINLSLTDERKLCTVPFRIRADGDVDKARAILLELARQHAKVLETVKCPITGLGKASVTLSLQAWCVDAKTADELKNDLFESAKLRFEKEGIPLFRVKRPN